MTEFTVSYHVYNAVGQFYSTGRPPGRRSNDSDSMDMDRKSNNPPWALHYDESSSQSTSSHQKRGSRYFDAEADDDIYRSPARDKNFVDTQHENDLYSSQESGVSAKHRMKLNHKPADNGEWKRPPSIAPKWAAGGVQDVLVGSPNPGRKVLFCDTTTESVLRFDLLEKAFAVGMLSTELRTLKSKR
jgi:hypothetical protein